MYNDLKISTEDRILLITNKTDKTLNDIYFGQFGKKFFNQNTIKLWRDFTKDTTKKKLNQKNNFLITKNLSLSIDIKSIIKSLFFIFSKNFYKFDWNLTLLNIFSHFRLVEQINHFMKIYKPKYVIFTLEGHLWENLLIQRCKKFDKKITTIGYQFTKINNKSNILKRIYVHPDYIFCSGNIDKKILSKKFDINKSYILGSPKYLNLKKKKFKKSVDFLILPNANINSLENLIKFFIKLNENNLQRNMKFVISNHPIMSLQNMNKIKKMIVKNKNFKISKDNLRNDLGKSKYLIFDESSISLYAYKFKTIPLYFDYSNTGGLNKDYNFPNELVVKNQKNLMQIYKRKLSKKTINYLKYVSKNYFLKMEKKKLNNFSDAK
jgi:hypothetical protein